MEQNFFFLVSICILNFIIILLFDKIKIFHFIIDNPDKDRKFHTKPTALAGGSILIINLIFYFLSILLNEKILDNEQIFNNYKELILFLVTCILIFLIGLLDDKFNFSPSLKFFLLFLALIFFLFLDGNTYIKIIKFSFIEKQFYLNENSVIFTLFCFLVFINAFNMFDGINLQSSSYLFIVLFFLFFVTNFSLFIFLLIIFVLTFKYLNFRNKSFLGDSGALLISFILGYIFIKLFNNKIILYSDEVFIFMMIPGIDMIRLFFERIKKRRNPFSHDRLHLHHLLLAKYGYFKTICIIILFIILPIFTNYIGIMKLNIIITTFIVYFLSIWIIKKKNN